MATTSSTTVPTPLTARAKWEIAGTIAAFAVFSLAFGSWIGAREDAIKMKATIDAQSQVIGSAQTQSKSIQDAEAERDKATAANVAALTAAAAKQVTPAEIADWLPKQVQTPQPITITVPAPTPQNPTPNATASIPESDLPALRDQVTQCQVCAQKLTAAQADEAAKDSQLKLAGEDLSAMTKERDAAVTASKGGSFWARLKSKAKWFAIGGAVAAGAVCATGHCK
jgi:hypothetical protein